MFAEGEEVGSAEQLVKNNLAMADNSYKNYSEYKPKNCAGKINRWQNMTQQLCLFKEVHKTDTFFRCIATLAV